MPVTSRMNSARIHSPHKMRFLADENFPRRVVAYLRNAGHDVLWVGNDYPGTSDKNILERAETDSRILVTLDRDFWQIAFQRPERMKNGGVVLIRVHPATAANIEGLIQLVMERGHSLVGHAALVTRWGIDIVPAGRENPSENR
jgi:predicted nuclease of predicted toxin-antitoxin system